VVTKAATIAARLSKACPYRKEGEQKVNRYTKQNSSEVKSLKTSHIRISNRDKFHIFSQQPICANSARLLFTQRRFLVAHGSPLACPPWRAKPKGQCRHAFLRYNCWLKLARSLQEALL
jgi:hypothetical protein